MFKDVPAQVWLLIAIAAIAYAPAAYIYRFWVHSPARRDITQPSEDLSWRTSRQFGLSIGMLGALVALAVFIFTPAAEQVARSPYFMPFLMGAIGAWALSSVPRGLAAGQIRPIVKGVSSSFERETQPKRFWASLSWNAIFGCLCIWLTYVTLRDVPEEALRARCYDWTTKHSPQEELSACNELLRKRDEQSNDYAGIISARGYAYHRVGDYDRALSDYSTALRIDGDDSYALYNRGLIYQTRGDYKKAIADYTRTIELRPEDADAYINRGTIYLDTGRFKKSIGDLTKAHDLEPRNPEPLALRGLAHAWRYDRQRAGADFAALQTIDPDNPILTQGDALLKMNADDFTGAVQSLTVALNRNPKDAWSLRMRANAYQQLGDAEKSQADADRLALLVKIGK
jgi:tetratricopeptide (TPR) repeat protein